MKSPEQLKHEVAGEVISRLDTTTLILGSGSTVNQLIQQLPENTKAVSSSRLTSVVLAEHRIDEIVLDSIIDETERICIDGADLVLQDQGVIIKGHGGALLREKISWTAATEIIVTIDESKLDDTISKTIPVVISPFSREVVKREVERQMDVKEVELLRLDNLPYNTDDGMQILHLRVEPDTDLVSLDRTLQAIPGVIETGIFQVQHYKIRILCGTQNGVIEL